MLFLFSLSHNKRVIGFIQVTEDITQNGRMIAIIDSMLREQTIHTLSININVFFLQMARWGHINMRDFEGQSAEMCTLCTFCRKNRLHRLHKVKIGRIESTLKKVKNRSTFPISTRDVNEVLSHYDLEFRPLSALTIV
jgi:hypothetical protein